MTDNYKVIRNDKNKLIEAISSLRRLVFLKRYEEQFGEDEYYEEQLAAAWERAKLAMDNLGDNEWFGMFKKEEQSRPSDVIVDGHAVAKLGLERIEAVTYARLLRQAMETMHDPQNPYHELVSRVLDEAVPKCITHNTS